MMDLASLSKIVIDIGAPILGGAIGGPGGALATTALKELAKSLGTSADPDAIEKAIVADPTGAAVAARQAEDRIFDLWEIEAKRVAKQEATEMEQGFAVWQFAKTAVQMVIWVGWIAILGSGLFGGNLGVKPLIAMSEIVKTWAEVTSVWMIVYNGGHTVKAVWGKPAG